MTRKVISMSPFRCRMWALHDRFESTISEQSCREEIASFSKHGQIVPVLGRVLRGDPAYDVELIFGARRLFVARHLGQDIDVELREMTDREALICMDVENRLRSDISPYERGMSYASWLRRGYFQTQDEIAKALKTSASQVSRLLKLARLPSIVVDAFATPADICENWGRNITNALNDPARRHVVVRNAREIAARSPRPRGHEVYRLLLSTTKRRRICSAKRERVIKDEAGQTVLRIRELRSEVALLIPCERISEQTLALLTRAIRNILLQESPTATRIAVELPERSRITTAVRD